MRDYAVGSTSNSACIIATRSLARVSLLSADPASHDLFSIALAGAAKLLKLRVRLLERALRPPARLAVTFCAVKGACYFFQVNLVRLLLLKCRRPSGREIGQLQPTVTESETEERPSSGKQTKEEKQEWKSRRRARMGIKLCRGPTMPPIPPLLTGVGWRHAS